MKIIVTMHYAAYYNQHGRNMSVIGINITLSAQQDVAVTTKYLAPTDTCRFFWQHIDSLGARPVNGGG